MGRRHTGKREGENRWEEGDVEPQALWRSKEGIGVLTWGDLGHWLYGRLSGAPALGAVIQAQLSGFLSPGTSFALRLLLLTLQGELKPFAEPPA